MKLRKTLLFLATILAACVLNLSAQPTNHWRIFTSADGLAEDACSSITVGVNGDVVVAHPRSDAASVLDGYNISTVPAPENSHGRIYESPSGQLWAVAPDGVLEFRETNWVLHSIAEIAQQTQSAPTNTPTLLPVRQGRVLILLSERLMEFEVESSGGGRTRTIHTAEHLQIGNFRRMTVARDGGLWLSGERGVVKLAGPLRNLKSDGAWNKIVPPSEMSLQNFTVLLENERNGVWVLGENADSKKALASFDGEKWTRQTILFGNVRFAWRGKTGSWAVTSDGLFELRDDQTEPLRHSEISAKQITDAAMETDGTFWLATSSGLFRYAPSIWVSSTATPPEEKKPTPLPTPPEDISKQAAWRTSLIARNGDIWLGAVNEIAWRHQSSWRVFSSTNQIGPENIVAFAEGLDGRICCATPDKIWEFDGRNWLTIRTGLGQTHALNFTRDGTLWVASSTGAHRFARGAWLQNDMVDGLPVSDVLQIWEDAAGQIFAATTAGVSVYQPDADRDAPRTEVRPLSKGEQAVREGNSVKISFRGNDKWNLTAANRLLYSYRLDEREWSPYQEKNEITFADLPLGKHYFQVRAMDRNANVDPQPARLEFSIVVPWYREARLVWILVVALAIAVFFAGLAFNRHRKLRLSYAVVEKKIAERTRELEIANRELLHSQKMNALGTLAAGIAHDFNNILSIIKGSSQIIEENLENHDKVRTRLDRIRTVVQQGAGIVEAMLGFSRNSEERIEAYDINIIVNDTLTLLGDRFLREVEIHFEPVADLPKTSVARDFVQQVLLNFIFNAAEAMTDRKHIDIATRRLRILPPAVVLSPTVASDYLAIDVKDSGSGISPEALPRIFEPFFTTKAMSARRGTGLGLSMVYELAKKMGAGLGVETTVGTGSTFTIFLPVKTDARVEPATPPSRS